MKISRNLRASAARIFEVLSRSDLEGKIAIVGLAVAVFGVFFSYYQVELLKRERLTPYRAILYTAKLDSFRRLAALGVYMQSSDQEVDNGNIIERSKLRRDRLSQILNVIQSEPPIWPDNILEDANKLAEQISEDKRKSFLCYNWLRDTQFEDRSALKEKCSFGTFRWERLYLMQIHEMRSDLRADSLQQIDSAVENR